MVFVVSTCDQVRPNAAARPGDARTVVLWNTAALMSVVMHIEMESVTVLRLASQSRGRYLNCRMMTAARRRHRNVLTNKIIRPDHPRGIRLRRSESQAVFRQKTCCLRAAHTVWLFHMFTGLTGRSAPFCFVVQAFTRSRRCRRRGCARSVPSARRREIRRPGSR